MPEVSNTLRKHWRRNRYQHRERKIRSIEPQILEFLRNNSECVQSIGDRGAFYDNFWKYFNPQSAICFIEDAKQGFSFEKEIIFNALVAWMISPTDPKIARSAIAISVGKVLVETEERVRKRIPESRALADIVTRLGGGRIDSEFFDNIYYPIGGLKTIWNAPQEKPFHRKLASKLQGVEEIIRLIDICHFHVHFLLSEENVRKPSINIGTDILYKIGYYPNYNINDSKITAKIRSVNARPKSRTVYHLWSQFSPSIALLHAASNVEIREGTSLLEAISSGGATYEQSRHLIPEWFGRTRFVSEEVLSQCAFTTGPQGRPLQIEAVEPVWFAPPELSDDDRKTIEKGYE